MTQVTKTGLSYASASPWILPHAANTHKQAYNFVGPKMSNKDTLSYNSRVKSKMAPRQVWRIMWNLKLKLQNSKLEIRWGWWLLMATTILWLL